MDGLFRNAKMKTALRDRTAHRSESPETGNGSFHSRQHKRQAKIAGPTGHFLAPSHEKFCTLIFADAIFMPFMVFALVGFASLLRGAFGRLQQPAQALGRQGRLIGAAASPAPARALGGLGNEIRPTA